MDVLSKEQAKMPFRIAEKIILEVTVRSYIRIVQSLSSSPID
ncbi:hypothetical protein XAC4311_2930005 [Xanthomonas citri pv. citri]|nr:hypothetical protein XAC2911_1460004 [Xanthomonas citri pv. citri]CEH47805.1 hypothetical protein XAC3615_13240002 [Xanthomonas citri pv. citri]CEL35895.1 hypothetical protein XAC4311_2930005 [Xanthomonas citri pv. citri]